MPGIESRPEIIQREPQGDLKIEIERKFIVKKPPADYRDYPDEKLVQGYTEDGTRYRRSKAEDGYEYTRTRKFGNGMVRQEEEVVIGELDFNKEWPRTEGRRVFKTRYFIPYGPGTIIHLDIYDGKLAGKVVAEPEFDSVELGIAFEPPDWFRDKKGRVNEVTGVKKYSNKRLASNGWPEK